MAVELKFKLLIPKFLGDDGGVRVMETFWTLCLSTKDMATLDSLYFFLSLDTVLTAFSHNILVFFLLL